MKTVKDLDVRGTQRIAVTATACVLLLLVNQIGCGKRDAEVKATNTAIAERQDVDTGTLASVSSGEHSEIETLGAVAHLSSRGVLADEMKHGDQRGDWESETFHDQIKPQLATLEHAFVAGYDHAEVTALTSSDFTTTPLVAPNEQLAEVYRDENFVVLRSGVLTTTLTGRGSEVLQQAIAAVRHRYPLATAVESHAASAPDTNHKPLEVHIKVYRVNLQTDAAETTMIVDFNSAADGLQQIVEWRCRWTREPDAPPRLMSLELQDCEEVRYSSGGLLFADCTKSVLGREACFDAQLRKSVDQWRLTIEGTHGVDSGASIGLAIGDANGDGLDDLYYCELGGLPNRLFLQQSDGTLRDVSVEAGVDWLDRSRGALFVDLDNDGDQDLLVSVGATLLVMSNDGAARFDIAAELTCNPMPYSLAACDYDNDGLLDLYVCGYGNNYESFADSVVPLPYHDANNGSANSLYRNRGDFNFENVTDSVGLDENNTRYSFSASWQDFDSDGDFDLYVANDFGRNNLYVNRINEDGKFHDMAAAYGVEDIGAGMSATWGDYDRDGWLDLYVSNMFSSAGNRITTQERFQLGADSQTVGHYQRFARGNSL
ncbi:MAG: VCBS repeat-containing protein, partial [Planctomycetales bacterium]|nr:VCBS repeat-containing protein [Planctomycetales bacterium]